MKRFIAAVAFSAALAMPAAAKNFAIPAKNPIATLVLPDDWSADEIDTGVEVTSKDGEVYIAFETVKAKNAEAALNDPRLSEGKGRDGR